MDRIKNLSLDQKAKLYYMALLQKGMIDTLPEDPKAAYIRDMMDKEDPKMDPAIRSDFDEPVFENDKDDYGRSVSGKDKRTFMEPEDSMPATRAKKMAQAAYDKAEMNGDIRGMELALAAMDIDKPIPGLNKRLKEIASELGYLNEEVDITYSTPGDRFYKMKVDGKRLKREEGTKYLKGLGIDLEVPRKYETNKLDDIVKALKKKGIKADYNDAMDVS
jgi:hypothetical protein